jgi:hypothetical protein
MVAQDSGVQVAGSEDAPKVAVGQNIFLSEMQVKRPTAVRERGSKQKRWRAVVVHSIDEKGGKVVVKGEGRYVHATLTFDDLSDAKKGTTWTDAAEGHELYEPPSAPTVTKSANGDETVSYVGMDGMQVTLQIPRGGMPTGVKAANVNIKPEFLQGFRGKMSEPSWYYEKMGIARAHLIADQFRGPGSATTRNLVPTSHKFNEGPMKLSEDSIVDAIKSAKAPADKFVLQGFDLELALQWEEFGGEAALRAIAAKLQAAEFEKYKDYKPDEIRAALDAWMARYVAEKHKPLKRCMDVRYVASLVFVHPDAKVAPVRQPIAVPATGADVWLGLE